MNFEFSEIFFLLKNLLELISSMGNQTEINQMNRTVQGEPIILLHPVNPVFIAVEYFMK
jgi:hypothetical protein